MSNVLCYGQITTWYMALFVHIILNIYNIAPFFIIRAFPSSVPNAKYLAFDTPNTKKHPTTGVLNAKTFGTSE